MALKEGRCYNCGSILLLDPKMEKGHCIYCDAVFDNKLAFEIAENPSAYEFKNEKMEKYTGPSLAPQANRPGIKTEDYQRAIEHNAAKKALDDQNKSQLELSGQSIPELKAPRKELAITLVVILAIFAIILAITIPTTKSRDQVREELSSSFLTKEDLDLNNGEDFLIRGIRNNNVIIILPEKPSESEVEALFKSFVKVRADIMEIEQGDQYKQVELEVMTPAGGYFVSVPDSGEAEIIIQEVKELE